MGLFVTKKGLQYLYIFQHFTFFTLQKNFYHSVHLMSFLQKKIVWSFAQMSDRDLNVSNTCLKFFIKRQKSPEDYGQKFPKDTGQCTKF